MSMGTVANANSDTVKGYLFKWTNYVRGYQRRWFVLVNGLLSYYRSQAEVNLTCRGTLNLINCQINNEDATGFVIIAAQTWHLKASSEAEKQRWIHSLELARSRAMKAASDANDEAEDEENVARVNADFGVELHAFKNKFEDLLTCKELIIKHQTSLLKELHVLVDIVNVDTRDEVQGKIKTITERATLLKISSNAMINSCTEFLKASEDQSKKWERSLKREQSKSGYLQDTVYKLAQQQAEFEKLIQKTRDGGDIESLAATGSAIMVGNGDIVNVSGSIENSEDEDDQFFDAVSNSVTTPVETVIGQAESTSNSQNSGSGANHDDADSESFKGSLIEMAEDPPIDRSSAPKPKRRRSQIPVRPDMSLNLWKILKNCVGKDLSRIPLPVNFNEPLTFLQRLAEDLEYSTLLDTAAKLESPAEQMAYVAVFALSVFASTTYRVSKPFNPLLHETYELDLTEDTEGWRMISEQVSHHPPISAQHVEGRGWHLFQEYSMNSGFRGKYLQIIPTGIENIVFADGNHYSFTKSPTIVNNIIVGTLSIYLSGEMLITNHTNGQTLLVKHHTGSIFATQSSYKITGNVIDKAGVVLGKISGCYNREMLYQDSKSLQPRVIWTRTSQIFEDQYHFSTFSMFLNEMDESVAPTDARRRKDVKLLEDQRWQESNEEKYRLEENQRSRRREHMANADPSKVYEEPPPIWFQNRYCNKTNRSCHVYVGGYWTAKKAKNYSKSPAIFD